VRAGFKEQRDIFAIFSDQFKMHLGFQIPVELRPDFALVGCHLQLQ
jgi:hypothetical protein